MSFSAFFPSYYTVSYYVCLNSFTIQFFMFLSLFYIFCQPVAGRPNCNTQPLVQTAVPGSSNNLRDCKFFDKGTSESSNYWFKCCCCFTSGIALGQLEILRQVRNWNFISENWFCAETFFKYYWTLNFINNPQLEVITLFSRKKNIFNTFMCQKMRKMFLWNKSRQLVYQVLYVYL